MPVAAAVFAALATAVGAAVLRPLALRPASIRRPHRSGDPAPRTRSRVSLLPRLHPTGLRSRRAQHAAPAAVATWVDDLAHDVRAGSTLRAAVAATLPADHRLATTTADVRLAVERGRPLADGADAWSRSGDRHLAAVGTVIAAITEAGGDAAAPLDRLSAAMRVHAADELERAAQSAQARLSARVLTFVPLAVLAVLMASDATIRAVVASPTGASLVGAGLAVNAVGAWWMRRIIDDAAR